jgi:hypothetical protein
VPTTNGVLHIMDQVVLPKVWRFPERNFMQFANKVGRFDGGKIHRTVILGKPKNFT